jgi:small subunit ribosomal protein S20
VANHKSAQKRARQNVVRCARNKSYLSKVKTAVKRFQQSLTEAAEKGSVATDKEKLVKLRSEAQSALAKAVKRGLIHKNNASRRTKRLSISCKKVMG